jgi:hypothetical protein
MPPIPPTQCQPLSPSAYAAYGTAFQLFAAGFVPDDVDEALLQAEVNLAMQQSGDPSVIIGYLTNKRVIKATVSESEATSVVAATMLLSSMRGTGSGWSCCRNSEGKWYPYHPKYGWDNSQRCAV